MMDNNVSEAGGTRTRDQRIKSPLLYQLSYSPKLLIHKRYGQRNKSLG